MPHKKKKSLQIQRNDTQLLTLWGIYDIIHWMSSAFIKTIHEIDKQKSE